VGIAKPPSRISPQAQVRPGAIYALGKACEGLCGEYKWTLLAASQGDKECEGNYGRYWK